MFHKNYNLRFKSFSDLMLHQDLQLKKNFLLSPLKLKTIIIGFSSKSFIGNDKFLITALGIIEKLTGIQSKNTIALKSINNFKVRSGDLLGCKVNMSGFRAHQFIDRLITQILPGTLDQSTKNSLEPYEVRFEPQPGKMRSQLSTSSLLQGPFEYSFLKDSQSQNQRQGSKSWETANMLQVSGAASINKDCRSKRSLQAKVNCSSSVINNSLSINISDPFQCIELEDNYEVFENVSTIELRFIISSPFSGKLINYDYLSF